jgi:predicted alpha-1,2-mannosidase
MKNFRWGLLLLVLLGVLPIVVYAACVDYVDPFIGTTGGGNTFPGATLPNGFIQLSPDTGSGSGAGGYKNDKPIEGFSHQHISGMGGPILGEISLLPMIGALSNPKDIAATGKSNESAKPGYYNVTLSPWNTKAELTCSDHVGFHQYTFPANSTSRILVDVGHCLYGTSSDWNSAMPVGGDVTVDQANQEVYGYMVYDGGRSTGVNWTVYFCAKFDTAYASCGTWSGSTLYDSTTYRTGSEIGAYLNFNTAANQIIKAKVGISWKSVSQARTYITNEITNWDFDAVKTAASNKWEAVLSKIVVEGGTPDQMKMFYTALYHALLMPNNWTGEAPAGYSGAYYEDFLCMWDTFRTVHPLLTLIQTSKNADMVNTLIKTYNVNGWTGDAHSAWQYEQTQGGTNADVIIADAYVKGLPGIDWANAYQAIKKNAFTDYNSASNDPRQKQGRYRLTDYRNYHYLPTNSDTSSATLAVSKTLEYVYNDFCVWQLAKTYGTTTEINDLQSRLLWYQNLWDSGNGFMRGKLTNGTWFTPFNPTTTETGEQYYEGHAWTWSWFVPHDGAGLISLLGGDAAFNTKLTTACDNYYQAWNEPGMLQSYLFIYSGKPDKTQYYVRKAISDSFNSGTSGLPGNDDSGTTSAWLAWSMMGIYPNAGQDLYFIGSPAFTKVTIHLENGNDVIINAPNASSTNKYIASATRNGSTWDKAWFTHGDIVNGATFDLNMVSTAQTWGGSQRPYSYSTGGGTPAPTPTPGPTATSTPAQSPTPTPTPQGGTTRYEAENATIVVGTIKTDANASGGSYVDGENGFNLTWIHNSSGGSKNLTFRIKVPAASTRSMGVYVNNTKVSTVTSSSTSWESAIVNPVSLNSGNNTIELRDSEGTTELDVDYLEVLEGAATPTPAVTVTPTPTPAATATPAATPTPGGDLCNGGTSSASAIQTGQMAAEAFDNNFTTSKWIAATTTAWIQYQFGGGNAYVVTRYTLTSGNDIPGRDPKNWQFQGSNDGTAWTTVDTRTGITFAQRLMTQSFTFTNSTAYKYYRVNITLNNGDAKTCLEEVEMFSN